MAASWMVPGRRCQIPLVIHIVSAQSPLQVGFRRKQFQRQEIDQIGRQPDFSRSKESPERDLVGMVQTCIVFIEISNHEKTMVFGVKLMFRSTTTKIPRLSLEPLSSSPLCRS